MAVPYGVRLLAPFTSECEQRRVRGSKGLQHKAELSVRDRARRCATLHRVTSSACATHACRGYLSDSFAATMQTGGKGGGHALARMTPSEQLQRTGCGVLASAVGRGMGGSGIDHTSFCRNGHGIAVRREGCS